MGGGHITLTFSEAESDIREEFAGSNDAQLGRALFRTMTTAGLVQAWAMCLALA